MAHILKLFEFAQHNGVAQVYVRRRWIHAEVHVWGFRLFRGLLKLGFQFIDTDDFGRTFLKIRELLFDRLELLSHYFFSGEFWTVFSTRRPWMRNFPSKTIRTASA